MNLLASLRYLVALSEHRHFARAAEACHVTQPALSNALRALEQEFGTPIVRRGRTFAGLTEEGERILLTARRMLREHELLQQDLRGSAAQPQGRLRLGVVPTAVPIGARFAAALRARHPGITPEVRSLSSPEIEAGLEDLTLDLGLGFAERVGGGTRFELLPQYEEHYFLLRGRADADSLVLGAPCSWEEAAARPLCLLSPEMHHRQIVQAAFLEAGAAIEPALETNSVLALVLAVSAGSLAAVVPGALAAIAPRGVGLEALPLVRPELATQIAFITLARAAPSRTLQAAQQLARDPDWLRELGEHAGRLASFKR
ncbi:MAG TPA: LysR substrate-binding domain-containing protein [Ramlibacter sp.]|nr:LysR substrate-binding domain-containing protein [Ramlibacter sp.]